MSSSSWRKSPCRESCLPGFWGGSPACARPVPRVEVRPLRQPSPKAVAGRPRCAARGDFEVYVAEKSRLRRLRGWVKRAQEFIRVGKSLLRTLRRSTMLEDSKPWSRKASIWERSDRSTVRPPGRGGKPRRAKISYRTDGGRGGRGVRLTPAASSRAESRRA